MTGRKHQRGEDIGRDSAELSAEEFDKETDGGATIARKQMKKENTRTMRMVPRRTVGLDFDPESMSSNMMLGAQTTPGGAFGKQPGSTRNAMHQKRLKNLNDFIQPLADIDGALSCSQHSAGSGREYNDTATLMMTDIDIFGNELHQYANTVKETLMNKRCSSGRMRDDPQEELEEVYAEIAVLEEDFKKTLGIS